MFHLDKGCVSAECEISHRTKTMQFMRVRWSARNFSYSLLPRRRIWSRVSATPRNRSATMFERYTEKARRAIFFARYEASQYGSTTIETEHLLLGILREDHGIARKFLNGKGGAQSVRDE